MDKLKKRIGEEEFAELDKIIKREINLLYVGDADVQVKKQAVILLLDWINKVYELDHNQKTDLSDTGFSLAGMFIEQK